MKIVCYKRIQSLPNLVIPVMMLLIVTMTRAQDQDMSTLIPDPVFITEDFESIYLKRIDREYPVDSSLVVEDAYRLIKSRLLEERRPAFHEFIWVVFYVENTLSEPVDLVLKIDNHQIDHYELYRIDRENMKTEKLGTGGDLYTFAQRKVSNRNFIEKFSQDPLRGKCYLLKIKDTERSTSIPLTLYDSNVFKKKELSSSIFHSIYFGGLIFIGLFSLIIGFMFRFKVFYTYGIYALMMVIYMLTSLGFAYQIFFPEHPSIQRILPTLVNPFLYFTFVLFASTYFASKERKRIVNIHIWIQFSLSAIVVIFWMVTLARFAIHYYILINYILLIYTFFVLGLLLYHNYRSERQKSVYFLLALTILFISGLTYTLSDAGIIRLEWLPSNPLLFGAIIEFGIFSVALIDEVRSINKTKNRLLGEKAAQQKRLLEAYVEGAEKERKLLSNELHDNIGSRLALMKHQLAESKTPRSKLTSALGEIYNEVRSMSHDLFPGDFRVIPFSDYLEMYLKKYQDSTGIEVSLIMNYLPDVDENTAGQLFRIIQEAAQNVHKHSGARKLEIQLIGYDQEIVMTIDDDGQGFDIDEVSKVYTRGISNIKTRVEALDGSIEIASKEAMGTHITISLQL